MDIESTEPDRVLAELVADWLQRLLKYRTLPGSPLYGLEISDPIRASHPDDGQEFRIEGRGGVCYVDVYPGRTGTQSGPDDVCIVCGHDTQPHRNAVYCADCEPAGPCARTSNTSSSPGPGSGLTPGGSCRQ